MKLCLAVILLSLPVWAQQLPGPTAGQYPDAPQPSCVYHGNPCPQWLAKTIGPYPVPPSEESMIERIRYPHYYADGPRFFQFRKGPHDDPATNRQVLHSKMFLIQSAGMWVAEELSGTRTGAHSERIAAAGVMGFSYLGYRFFSPSFTLGEDGAAISWLREWRNAR